MSISHEHFHAILKQNGDGGNVRPINHLYQLSKQISQLIAKSWLPEGESIREVFLSGDSDKIMKMLKEQNTDIDILGKQIIIEMDWDSFFGGLIDINNPIHNRDSSEMEYLFKLKIGYPPKPSEYNLSDADLEAWVADDGDCYEPNTPYIPVTW
ncbi:MAG: hypothetical protein AB8B99_14290 [Phormidesmis sp.]